MAERINQSVALRVPLQAYLAADHVTPAGNVAIAVVLSKNGAAYGNSSAGAGNATFIGNGSFYFDITTTDTGTLGPLFVLGTSATLDNVVAIYNVVNANGTIGNATFIAGTQIPAVGNVSGNVTGSVGSVVANVTLGANAIGNGTFVAGTVLPLVGNITGVPQVNTVQILDNTTAATGIGMAGIEYAATGVFSSNLHLIEGNNDSVLGLKQAGLDYVNSGNFTLPPIVDNWLTGNGTDATAVTKLQAGLANTTNIVSVGNVSGNVAGSVGSVVGNVGRSVLGNVAGSVFGNLSGNVAGSIQGNLAGSVLGNVAAVTGNVGGVLSLANGTIGNGTFIAGTQIPATGNVSGNVTGSLGNLSVLAASTSANATAAQITIDHGAGSYNGTGNVTVGNVTLAASQPNYAPSTVAQVAALANLTAPQVLAAIVAYTINGNYSWLDLLKDTAAALGGNATGNGGLYKLPDSNTTRLTVTAGNATNDRIVTRS